MNYGTVIYKRTGQVFAREICYFILWNFCQNVQTIYSNKL